MSARPKLVPSQLCFVVDEVGGTADACASDFGWGPFHRFRAEVPDARYRDWVGLRDTEVALGMAGKVQIELIHSRAGEGPVESYQARYGRGLQHVGIGCASRDAALDHLLALGGTLNERQDYEGVHIAFVDTPCGAASFELLQADRDATLAERPKEPGKAETTACTVDRTTIVTDRFDATLRFLADAFGWDDAASAEETLEVDGQRTRWQRCVARAGALEWELLGPLGAGDDPYRRHLQRGDHGLVHAGAADVASLGAIPTSWEARWVERGDALRAVALGGVQGALALRVAA